MSTVTTVTCTDGASPDQADAVDLIEREFDATFMYENDGGNPPIAKPVLREFRRDGRRDTRDRAGADGPPSRPCRPARWPTTGQEVPRR